MVLRNHSSIVSSRKFDMDLRNHSSIVKSRNVVMIQHESHGGTLSIRENHRGHKFH